MYFLYISLLHHLSSIQITWRDNIPLCSSGSNINVLSFFPFEMAGISFLLWGMWGWYSAVFWESRRVSLHIYMQHAFAHFMVWFCLSHCSDLIFLVDRPILLAPKFGLEDTPTADFDATLVLATMLLSQLREGNVSEGSPAAPVASGKQDHGNPHEHLPCHASAGEASRRMVVSPNNSQNPSNHTRIWSELSGGAIFTLRT